MPAESALQGDGRQADWYREYFGYLRAVAYRMLGSMLEAEDVVQDVFEKLHQMKSEPIRDAKAFLTRMVVNRSLDALRSARKRREVYPGPWLPEPVGEIAAGGPEQRALAKESVSYALMVVLEKLTPLERAVFLLHEALGYGYADTAELLGRTEAACRKLLSRARRKLADDVPEGPQALGFRIVSGADGSGGTGGAEGPDGADGSAVIAETAGPAARLEEAMRLTERFLQAVYGGQSEALMEWLLEDVVCVTDGGGVMKAALRPVFGADRVAMFLAGLVRQNSDLLLDPVPLIVGGLPAIGLRAGDRLDTVVVVEWRYGKVRRIYMVRNPAKLKGVPFP